ncbi:MAG: 3-keto-5-aminohexanoate cleavage protein [Clostridiales bacterium]|nr:3-keto-5-aminohexanoate cleavage protein [Clostridiales bacterium]
MAKKLIITAALCGAGTKKSQTPYVPVTPEEISDDAIACAKAGASVIHIHVRDDEGNNTMSTERFTEVVNLIREKMAKENVDLVLNLTTSGSKFPEDMRRAHLPILKPEMCSYDALSMNWANSYIFSNTPSFLETLGHEVQELEIKPECEIFNGGDMGNIDYYVKKGVLKAPVHYQFVLGVTGGMPGDASTLAYMLPRMQPGSTWSITGIGRAHMPCLLMGLALGCDGIRVGLEDNIYMEKGVLATNVSLVERAVKIAEDAGREIATAAEAREILGLKKHI